MQRKEMTMFFFHIHTFQEQVVLNTLAFGNTKLDEPEINFLCPCKNSQIFSSAKNAKLYVI